MHGQTGVTDRTHGSRSIDVTRFCQSVYEDRNQNIDDYMLKPLGESYFQWNMQFNDDAPDIVGDRSNCGASAVMQKKLNTETTALLQTVSNNVSTVYQTTKPHERLAISQDIDPDSLVNDMNEAAICRNAERFTNAQQGQAQKVAPLVSNQQAWEGLEAYLKDLHQLTIRGW